MVDCGWYVQRWVHAVDMCNKFICAIFAGALAVAPLLAQNEAATVRDLYLRCVADITNASPESYNPCKQYLEQNRDDDARRIEYVRAWIAKYEKVLPYLQFLQGLTTEQNAPWFVYEPDMGVELPPTSVTEGPYKIQISRTFSDSNEEQMLRKAEAVYSSPSKMIADVLGSLNYWASKPSEEMAPIWGMTGNDNIQSTNVVTARAVRYYYDLWLAAKSNPRLPTEFDALSIGLKYEGLIKHFDRYSHSGDNFENVFVADLTLQWGFTCGSLCGMGFTRNKLVVLDAYGNVVAMYLDAPVNSESWVS
jgi:hypothetical protein